MSYRTYLKPYVVLLLCCWLFAGRLYSQTIMGITIGKLPQLAYSNGEDRLGSAKMGYIDTGVSLMLLDSAAGLCHVQLSKYHTAYIDAKQLLYKPVDSASPVALTESWSSKGDDLFDYFNISLNRKIAYKSWMETNPARIIIDLYSVKSNTNWITQLQSVKEIDHISFVQNEDDVVQITITLKHR